tara:strand:+ start:2202 stop:2624 length:423 start_codon:yes stop_codon:yes gene_type:complete
MKKFIILLILNSFTSFGQTEPWTRKQLVEPADLANIINKENNIPKIISIGPGVVIKNSIGVGECRFKENLDNLEQMLLSLSKEKEIIVYCGCCPFKDCPNIRPVFSLMNRLGFINHKLLNVSNNIKTDWIDKDYPTDEIN